MRVSSILNLTRLHTAGWESFIFILGPLLVGVAPPDHTVLLLALIGVLINAFIFVLNDLADLPKDRLDPRRQKSPLVSGEVSSASALLLACVLPITMWLLIALDDWTTTAEVAFASLLFLGAFLCIYQKATPVHPLVLDVLFGVAMAGPIPVGIAAVHRDAPAYVWAITSYFFVLCVGLNAVGGNLKDLRADLGSGSATVAIAFGVRPEGTSLTLTGTYRRFLYVIGAALIALGLAALALSYDGNGLGANTVATTSVVILLAAMGWSLQQLAMSRRAPSPRGREPFVAFGGGCLLILAALHAPIGWLIVATGGGLAWELSFRYYWSRRA